MSNYNDFNNYNDQRSSYDSNNTYYGDNDVVSIGTWVLVLIGTAIPFVSIIVLLVLAFGVNNENLKNYGKAALILWGIGLLLAFMLGGCTRIMI